MLRAVCPGIYILNVSANADRHSILEMVGGSRPRLSTYHTHERSVDNGYHERRRISHL